MTELFARPIVMSIIAVIIIVLVGKMCNIISYTLMKERIISQHRWDLNICCGKTDAGGINADIIRHAQIPNFVLIKDIYNLPFADKQFKRVLCSHTMEHVERPEAFFSELSRVGETVTIIVPPLWDFFAAFNFLEHKWIFLTLRKAHHCLPGHFPLPLADHIHKCIGQRFKA
ncbi:MAG: methyltransferase domain-containing protein [Desulfotignum sp.]|nr:methyltransferase domain-containing protein [Desulfotignum sp.]